MHVCYEIDADDRIVGHDRGWEQFALDNDAPLLANPSTSTVLWDAIADETTTLLWRTLVDHVRAAGEPIDIRYRCDAPHARRWFEATLTPFPDGRVRFDAHLVREELREPVVDERFDVDPDRLIRMCSWCARFECEDDWCEIEDVAARERWLERRRQPIVTHTICPSCFARQLAELDGADPAR
ncbi:MAG: hypothetical protein ACLGHQ_12925 [Acidimicrobiia bacterium]